LRIVNAVPWLDACNEELRGVGEDG
jgi:hypothetical protein